MTVSLCVVAFNEEKFLPNLLEDFKNQTYPHELIEIVLVNSASTDNTKKIMEQFALKNKDFYSVIVVDNPKKIQASGWNIAIQNFTGDVMVRIDAHTHVPPNFTAMNMENIKNGEFVSGGVRPCLIEHETNWSKTLLQVENSLFGSSFNKCRRSSEKTYVKTMFHAAYRREVFKAVGGFNENLLRTEDNEIHYRIRNAGYKLCYDPRIVSYQFARSNLKKMVKQKYGNGKWIGLTLGVCPKCISLFHLVPLFFVLGIVATTIATMLGMWQLAILMWSLYGLFAATNTIISVIQEGFLFSKLAMPFLFLLLHISYGIGTFVGLLQMPVLRKKLKICYEIQAVKEILQSR